MRILLLSHENVTPGSFFQDYLAGIGSAARELGHSTVTFGYQRIGMVEPAERDALYRLLAADNVDIVIDPCCWGYALTEARVWDGSAGGESLFDSAEVACVGLLCDQPYYQPLQGMVSRHLHAAFPDRTHGEQIAMIHPEIRLRTGVFMPPGARVENDRSVAWPQRDIDLLYVGNLMNDALQRPWRGSPEAARCDELAERALASPDVPLHRVLARMVLDERIDATPADLCLWLQRVEYLVRARLRLDAVQAAAASGVHMHVVGEGWDRQSLPSTVTRHPAVSYAELFALAGRARMALDASTYLNGANDRIFNYVVNRCMPLTNARGYLEGAFPTGMRFYAMRDVGELGAMVRDALSQPLRDEMEAARTLALEAHSWRQRIGTLLEAVQRITED